MINDGACGSGTALLDFKFTDGGAAPTITWTTSGNPATANGATPPMPNYDSAGVYQITVLVQNGECPDVMKTVNFTVAEMPNANVEVAQKPRCLDPTPSKNRIKFKLDARTGVNYRLDIEPKTGWHFINGNANSPNSEIQIDDCGILKYKFTAWNHCDTLEWTRTDTFYKSQTAVLPTLPNACKQKTIDFSGTIFNWGCDPKRMVLWSFPEASQPFSTDLNPFGISVASPDSLKIFYIFLTIYGTCDTTEIQTQITIEVPKEISISPSPVQLCQNEVSISLTPSTSGGNFLWNKEVIPAQFPPADFPVGKTDTIFYEKSEVCKSSGFVLGTLHPQPTLSAGADIKICVEKGSVVLAPTTNAVAPVFNWKSNNPKVSIVGNTAFFSEPLTAELSVTVTDANGCSKTSSLNLTVEGNTPLVFAPLVLCNTADTIELPFVQQYPGLVFSGMGVTADKKHIVPAGLFPGTTLHWTNTNSTDCTTEGAFFIQIDNLLDPPPSAGDPTVICQNGPIFTRTAQPDLPKMQWLDAATGAVVSTTGLLTIDPSVFQKDQFVKYILIYRKDEANCPQRSTVEFHIVHAQPDAGDGFEICVNADPVALVPKSSLPPDFKVFWTGSTGVNQPTANFFDPAKAMVGSHSATLNYEYLLFDCPLFSESKTITVNRLAGSNFEVDMPICSNKFLKIRNLTLFAGSQKWYVDGGGSPVSTDFEPNDLQLSSGLHTIWLVSETAEFCADTFKVEIFVNTPPAIQSTPDKISGCGPLAVYFKNLATPQVPLFYVVSGAGPSAGIYPAKLGNDTLTLLPGPEVVKYNVALVGGNECDTARTSVEIIVKPRPIALGAAHYDSPCSGDSILVEIFSTGNPTSNTLYTSLGHQFPMFLQQGRVLQFFTNPPDTLHVSMWLVSQNECGDSTFYFPLLTVSPSDVSAFAKIGVADSTRICAGDSVLLTAFVLPATADFFWKNQLTGEVWHGASLLVPAREGANHWILFARGCGYDSMDVHFVGRALPSLLVNVAPSLICQGAPASFAVSSSGNFTLHFGDGDSTKNLQQAHVYKNAGICQISALAISPEGCAERWSDNLEVHDQPEAVIELPEFGCTRREINAKSTGAGAAFCRWTRSGSPDTLGGCSVNLAFQQEGLQWLRLFVQSAVGCTNWKEEKLIIQLTPTAGLLAILPQPRCAGDTVLLENQSKNSDNSTLFFGDGGQAAGTQGSVWQHIYLGKGPFFPKIIATRAGVCPDTATAEVRLFDRPKIEFELLENCKESLGYLLQVQKDTLGTSVDVSGPGGYHATGHRQDGLPTGYYHIVATDSIEGCTAEKDFFVPKAEGLSLRAEPDYFKIILGETCQFFALANANGLQYGWSPATGLSDQTLADPIARPRQTTVYTVSVADTTRGCTEQAEVLVEVVDSLGEPLIYVPNEFSPNQDNSNEVFRIRCLHPAVVAIESFRIRDQFGELVFEIKASDGCPVDGGLPPCAWDGRFRGQPVAAGNTYYWELALRLLDDLGRGVFTSKGSVLILK